jgi:hypothetical protein
MMKTKICSVLFLLFLMSCSPSDKSTAVEEKPTTTDDSKFIIKASNQQYLTIAQDSILIANQPDPTKAEVFEKVDQGNGKIALMASTGKYVCADRSRNASMIVNRNYAGEWETFEIIYLDKTKINLKASNGKFVSADRSAGNLVNATRDAAGDWETFNIQAK